MPTPASGKRYLSTVGVAARYTVHVRTIKGWREDPEVKFPKPDLEINGRDYTDETKIEDWEARQRAAATVANES
jgi:hypothetical protein